MKEKYKVFENKIKSNWLKWSLNSLIGDDLDPIFLILIEIILNSYFLINYVISVYFR